jgi:hypothetical protein
MAKASDRLTGSQIEEWLKDFALRIGIIAKPDLSLERTVRLIQSNLDIRFRAAMVYSPNLQREREYIESILQGRSPNIPIGRKESIKDGLLDYAVATDVCIKLKDASGKDIMIAIDVTGNPAEEQEKIDRVRGLPEIDDPSGFNRNENLPFTRKELGIDRHLVLVVKSNRALLPTETQLLGELEAFAQGKSRTGVLNLSEIHLQAIQSPQAAWTKLSQGLGKLEHVERLIQIARRSIEQGDLREFTAKILSEDPFVKGLSGRANPEQLIDQLILRGSLSTNDLQVLNIIEQTLKIAGTPVEEGLKYEGRNYEFLQKKNYWAIAAQDGRGLIFEIKDGYVKNRLTTKDYKTFDRLLMAFKNEQQQKRNQNRGRSP